MVFGSFDPLHEGHRSLFRQARRHGDELVVVLALDSSIRRLKGRAPFQLEEERLERVKAEPLVDEAVLGDAEDFLKVVGRFKPDVLLLGYDQEVYEEEVLRRELAARGLHPEIKRAVAFKPGTYKSRLLRRQGRRVEGLDVKRWDGG